MWNERKSKKETKKTGLFAQLRLMMMAGYPPSQRCII